MTRVYLFEIIINCKYGKSLTFLIENKNDADTIMELTDYERLLSEEILPLNYNRDVSYKVFERKYISDKILNYDQVLEKWNKYMKLYKSLQFYTDNFKKLYVKDNDERYLRFKSISFDIQIAYIDFYNCCESYYDDINDIDAEQYYNDVVETKNDIIDRRRYINRVSVLF